MRTFILSLLFTVATAADAADFSYSGTDRDGQPCTLEVGTDDAGKVDQLILTTDYYYTGILVGKTDLDAEPSRETRSMITNTNAKSWQQSNLPFGLGLQLTSAGAALQNGQSELTLWGASLDHLDGIEAEGGVL